MVNDLFSIDISLLFSKTLKKINFLENWCEFILGLWEDMIYR